MHPLPVILSVHTPWSIAIAYCITFSLFGLAGFGVVTGVPLLLVIAAALAVPALILRDSAAV